MTLEEFIKENDVITEELLIENGYNPKNVMSLGFKKLRGCDFNKAYKYFSLYEILQPSNFANVFMVFFTLVKLERYEEALEEVKKLLANDLFIYDTYTYLILLRDYFNIEIPELNNITYLDIIVPPTDDRFKNRMKENEIRACIYQGNYRAAKHKMLTYRKQNECEMQNTVISRLINANIKQLENDIIFYVEEGKFEELRNYYNSLDNISKMEKLQLDLINKIEYLNEGGILPFETALPKEHNIYDAVEANNYQEALLNCHLELTKYLLNTVINLNQYNIENSYLNILTPSLEDLISDIYYTAVEGAYEDIEPLVMTYLNTHKLAKFGRYFKVIIIDVINRLKEVSLDDEYTFNEVLATLTDNLVRISMPVKAIDTLYLENLAKHYIKTNNKNELTRTAALLDNGIFYSNSVSHKEINTTYLVEYDEEKVDEILNSLKGLKDFYKIGALDFVIIDKIKEKIEARDDIKYVTRFDGMSVNLYVCAKTPGNINMEQFQADYENAKMQKMFRQYKDSLNILENILVSIDYFDMDLIKTIAQLHHKLGNNKMQKKYAELSIMLKYINKKDESNDYYESEIDDEYNYQIPYIDEIIKEYFTNRNIDILLEKYQVIESDRLYVLAILAREAYRNTSFEEGYKIIGTIRKEIKEKDLQDEELVKFINAIEYNKSYYQYREIKEPKEKAYELIKGE